MCDSFYMLFKKAKNWINGMAENYLKMIIWNVCLVFGQTTTIVNLNI